MDLILGVTTDGIGGVLSPEEMTAFLALTSGKSDFDECFSWVILIGVLFELRPDEGLYFLRLILRIP